MRKFVPPSGRFDGVIGGPPCQAFSTLRHLVRATGGKLAENLIPEYERVVGAAAPTWFLMENVPAAPEPVVPGYVVRSVVFNNRWAPDGNGDSSVGAEQNRVRRFSFGTRNGRPLIMGPALFDCPRTSVAVLASSGGGACDPNYDRGNPNRNGAGRKGKKFNGGEIRKGSDLLGDRMVPVATVTANGTQWDPEKKRPRSFRSHAYFVEACRLQGVPEGFDLPPFTVEAKIKAVGNGVPYPLARAVARAVREAVT